MRIKLILMKLLGRASMPMNETAIAVAERYLTEPGLDAPTLVSTAPRKPLLTESSELELELKAITNDDESQLKVAMRITADHDLR